MASSSSSGAATSSVAAEVNAMPKKKKIKVNWVEELEKLRSTPTKLPTSAKADVVTSPKAEADVSTPLASKSQSEAVVDGVQTPQKPISKHVKVTLDFEQLAEDLWDACHPNPKNVYLQDALYKFAYKALQDGKGDKFFIEQAACSKGLKLCGNWDRAKRSKNEKHIKFCRSCGVKTSAGCRVCLPWRQGCGLCGDCESACKSHFKTTSACITSMPENILKIKPTILKKRRLRYEKMINSRAMKCTHLDFLKGLCNLDGSDDVD
eukprot:CAMPEP_0197652416 /NCGR_PEP_ID=MMETSP1338-20131121/34440_1 /TAXON_ID=43686 ORGANISM="Pelagodinium beii, Strain RCC1491" /NCGR_SAMPLE_ID=MMETSP1338 /ASSEMBLY_ACC=CAM_ASM_000754 /LENGTH=263 /DNA_ID=CAMNT_0043227289 /DNA_START=36 /DNA_END=827 /DNA_ORIENTATION=+